jgi:hypothetical protein
MNEAQRDVFRTCPVKQKLRTPPEVLGQAPSEADR